MTDIYDVELFENIFNHIIDLEGGYSNHRYDLGGETKFGITEATARRNGYEGSMYDLSLQTAKGIYYQEYWLEPGFNKIKEYTIACELFEQGVNLGPHEAVKNFQKSINYACRNVLEVDGIIGAKTLTTYKKCSNKNEIYVLLNVFQAQKYISIVKNNPSQRAFLKGWLKRVNLTKE
ncbi:MAG TPA: glycosyl hydrolase 108 family protein [Halanaerobiales bacterium]|nr:glycosyl hydrolase 108 family protein [Halanaerobiales bacterium]